MTELLEFNTQIAFFRTTKTYPFGLSGSSYRSGEYALYFVDRRDVQGISLAVAVVCQEVADLDPLHSVAVVDGQHILDRHRVVAPVVTMPLWSLSPNGR